MEQDKGLVCSEATFSFSVSNFSKLKESVAVRSPTCYVRNLPWDILVMPRTNLDPDRKRSLGFYLQCNTESASTLWSCHASVEMSLLSVKQDVQDYSMKTTHLFYSKENDWGFSQFMSWDKVLDEKRGYIKNDTITLQVKVKADVPHGGSWVAEKHAGCVSLQSQGSTFSMNSVTQTPSCTNTTGEVATPSPTTSQQHNQQLVPQQQLSSSSPSRQRGLVSNRSDSSNTVEEILEDTISARSTAKSVNATFVQYVLAELDTRDEESAKRARDAIFRILHD